MIRGAVFLLALSVVSPLSAQRFAFEFWHDGKVILDDGDTLKGSLKYDMMQDIVQYMIPEKTIIVYTPKKVIYYEIFDETVNRYRDFYSLPYANQSGYKVPTFFELLAEGKMTLLGKEALEYRTSSSPYYYSSRLYLVHHYFFLKENGQIEEFTGKKEDLLDRMGRQSDAVAKYIHEKRLRVDDHEDFVKIITYYNSLFKS